jgi:hypothetical protein
MRDTFPGVLSTYYPDQKGNIVSFHYIRLCIGVYVPPHSDISVTSKALCSASRGTRTYVSDKYDAVLPIPNSALWYVSKL